MFCKNLGVAVEPFHSESRYVIGSCACLLEPPWPPGEDISTFVICSPICAQLIGNSWMGVRGRPAFLRCPFDDQKALQRETDLWRRDEGRLWKQLSSYRLFRLNEVTMAKLQKRGETFKSQKQPDSLKGWKQISEFLGEPVSVVKRWAAEGMPLQREGQFVSTSSNELNAWLGKESGKPVHVATENTDLTAELKRGLSFIRREKQERPKNKQAASSRNIKR